MIQATVPQLLCVHSPRRTHIPPSAQTIIITRSEAATFDSFVGRVCARATAFLSSENMKRFRLTEFHLDEMQMRTRNTLVRLLSGRRRPRSFIVNEVKAQ